MRLHVLPFPRWPRPGYAAVSGWFAALGLAALLSADLHVTSLHPLADLRRLLGGLVRPDFFAVEGASVLYTVAFAVLGVGLGTGAGFLLAIPYARFRAVRIACAFLRAVHELFWALLLMQVFGLSATTGILAIALPYAGICAKVYAEIIERSDPLRPPRAARGHRRRLGLRLRPLAGSAGLDPRLHLLPPRMRDALDPGAGVHRPAHHGLLPRIGLPPGALRRGRRPDAGLLRAGRHAAPLGASLDPAAPPRGSVIVLPATVGSTDIGASLARFLGHDILPAPLRHAPLLAPETWAALWAWFRPILTGQILPGTLQTLVLAQVALVATAIGALVPSPLTARHFAGPVARPFGRILLVTVRSTPEYMMAYVALQLLGPSMLPAILALSIHNAGIIGYLMGRHADGLTYRPDAPRGLDLYAYETLPRLYGQFLAYLLYRWEIILRESAIFGILGVATLGFYVDAAIAELRLDVAAVLILATALLAVAVDTASRALRRSLRISDLPVRLARPRVSCLPEPVTA